MRGMVENLIILVHGTFARTARWVEPDSAFAQVASSTLPAAEVRPFRWTGKNNHQARVNAGRELALFISELCIRYPFADLHLIGHSHGGNVILYALNQHPNANRITTTSFLGTPFLVPLSHDIKSRFAFVEIVLPFALGIIGCFASILLFAGLFEIWPSIVVESMLFFVAWFLSIPVVFWFGHALGVKISQIAHRKVEQHQRLWASTIAAPAPPCRAFIAASARDEAAAWLRLSDKIAFFPSFILSSVRKFISGVVFAGFLMFALLFPVGIVLAFLEPGSHELLAFEAGYTFAVAFSLVGAVIAALLMLVVAMVQTLAASLFRGAPVFFGGEDPLLILAMRIMPQRVPSAALPQGSHVEYFDFPLRLFQLRHSAFYDDQHVLAALANWLAIPAPRQVEASVEKDKGIRHRNFWTPIQKIGFWSALVVALISMMIAYFDPILFRDVHVYLGLDIPEGFDR